MQYLAYKHWNIVLGCNAVRISTSDSVGHEFFTIVPQDGSGRENKSRRDRALDYIEAYIQDGGQPGEIPYRG